MIIVRLDFSSLELQALLLFSPLFTLQMTSTCEPSFSSLDSPWPFLRLPDWFSREEHIFGIQLGLIGFGQDSGEKRENS